MAGRRLRTDRPVGILRAVAGLVLAVALLAAGCGDDIEETEYGEANREAFLAACTDSPVDDRLIRDVCECTYDEIEASMTLAELTDLEESLRLDALRPLPDEVAGYVAACFLAEVDL